MRNGPYTLIRAPDDYPGKKYRGKYCYEHHLIWWSKTKTLVPEGFILHHKNENKHDNQFENLELKTREAHSRDHVEPAKMICLICSKCGSEFEREARQLRSSRNNGQKLFFCSRSHATSYCYKEGSKIRRIPHGKRHGYTYHGCRCLLCTEAQRKYMCEYKAKRRSAGVG